MARVAATNVTMRRLNSGHMLVTIDGGSPFVLTPALANLLEVLLRDRGEEAGPIVDWKSRGDIVIHLSARESRRVLRRSLKQRVFRLSQALELNGHSRRLIESHRNLGLRFALRREVLA